MYWKGFSRKQLQLLSWWTEGSPYQDMKGIIAEGAVRSGKTIVMIVSYVLWAMKTSNGSQYIIAGKTIGALNRNVITPAIQILINRGYNVTMRRTDNLMIISRGKISNKFYLFGGRDERSQDLVQGLTARGVMFDEVALMPRSFVEQAMARCSEEGAKLWFNCNPEGPQHWFYIEHIKQAEKHKYLRLHFNLEDNPSLSAETIADYQSRYTGIFYKRFILGEWAAADGVIYDCFDEERDTYSEKDKKKVLPIQIIENDPDGGYPYYGADFGTYNPTVFLEVYKRYKKGDEVPHFYVDDMYYYDGHKAMKQRTPEEHIEGLLQLINGKYYRALVVDPSASPLIVTAIQHGIPTIKADNDVMEGILKMYTLMSTGHIHINKDKCQPLINELGLYIWNSTRGENGKDEPVKQNDHACDSLRYVCQMADVF